MPTRETEQLNGSKRHPHGVLGQDRARACRRAGATALAVVIVGGLAACGSAGPSHVASLPSTSTTGATSTTSGTGTTSTLATGSNPTALVDEWAACERRHGDPSQVDPVIDSHGVINISIRAGVPIAGQLHGGAGTPQQLPCSRFLAKAQIALRGEYPVADPQGVTNTATIIAYVNCMRANGVANYPYPVGDKSNFNGTGVNPNSPKVIRVNDLCGKKLGLPAWWINGWGPPGDISVTSGPNGGPPPGVPHSGVIPKSNG